MSTKQNQNFKNALCYIPLFAFVILFIEEKKDEELKKHIRKWIILFWIYFILSIFIGLFSFYLNGLLALIYLIISWILWYKVYKQEKIDISILNDIEDKVKDVFK